MKWPWVSRGAYDAVVDERNRLRTENARMLEHLTRMDRVDRGLGETPKVPRAPLEPMPEVLRDHFAGYANKNLARAQRNEALKRYQRGETWERITKDAMPPEHPEESDDGPAPEA